MCFDTKKEHLNTFNNSESKLIINPVEILSDEDLEIDHLSVISFLFMF